ncbi:Nn.00g061110.m01.CDS01 [Neocucurbitaria sp. VM-36]
MSLFRAKAAVRAGANNLSDRLRMRTKTIYEDECMKLETHYNVVKDAVKDTAPYIVATGLGKIMGSFKRTRFQTPLPPIAKTTRRAADRGRIDKHKRFNFPFPEMGKLEAEARAKYEERQLMNYRVAQEANVRKAETRSVAKEEGARNSSRLPSPPPLEPVDYMSTLQDHLPSEDPAVRQQFINGKLKSILGEQCMHLGVGLPSGHSGIDPVIAEYNQQKATAELHQQIEAWKAEERRKAEEQQQQLAREEEERQRIQAILEVARGRYMEHVEILAKYGPQLREGITMMDAALHDNNMPYLANIVQAMTTEILEPANALFKEMDNNIPLEEEGARVLKEQWPVERIDEVYTFLKNESSLPAELVYFGQGIEAICKPILNPTPFNNPLDPKPAPAFAAYPAYTGGATTKQFIPDLTTSSNTYPVPAPLAPAQNTTTAPTDFSANLMSFTNACNTAPAHNDQQGPSITVAAPSGSSTNSPEKQDLMLHMQSTLFELQMNVADLMKGDSLPSNARQEVTDTLKQFVDYANGKKKVLTDDEGVLFKDEVKRVRGRIGNMKNTAAKKAIKTRELESIAHKALGVWISDL